MNNSTNKAIPYSENVSTLCDSLGNSLLWYEDVGMWATPNMIEGIRANVDKIKNRIEDVIMLGQQLGGSTKLTNEEDDCK